MLPSSTERLAGQDSFIAQAGPIADESPAGVAATFREVVVRYSDARRIARYESRLHWEPAAGPEAATAAEIWHWARGRSEAEAVRSRVGAPRP